MSELKIAVLSARNSTESQTRLGAVRLTDCLVTAWLRFVFANPRAVTAMNTLEARGSDEMNAAQIVANGFRAIRLPGVRRPPLDARIMKSVALADAGKHGICRQEGGKVS